MYSGSVTEVFTAEQIAKCGLIGFLMLNAVFLFLLFQIVFSLGAYIHSFTVMEVGRFIFG